MEYEIPCLNLVERLPGLWEPWKPCSNALPHAGLRLCPEEAPLYHLTAIFTHLQVINVLTIKNTIIEILK